MNQINPFSYPRVGEGRS